MLSNLTFGPTTSNHAPFAVNSLYIIIFLFPEALAYRLQAD
ncbi:hypothetical protein OHAE_5511 [Ochrobactrum soli]|uniref:Uncharacterized protein n=1 Tax=Ochrobactrum soli TaxID=2448455 RepID=A0A2P9HEC8_9HYPH|nr:hypothetical protein OHAE_5511 [[Ochrobactrum] soli]